MGETQTQPLSGITVLDFGHTVMGPSCGLILAELGAKVIKVEPVGQGDPTRQLKGFGTGYFGFFNRNKHSLSVDLKTMEGQGLVRQMICEADVLIENFAPGTMERLGLGEEMVKAINPRLVYARLKGFLPGPYEDRLALDEVVQMMGGLAYMTGPSGRPLRAGTSVVDICGGMFAVIGILAELRRREETGEGQPVMSALYETTVFLMGQHLCYAAQSDAPVPPMPERVSAWCIYEPFDCSDGEKIFIGITTDAHWQRFCAEAGWDRLAADPELDSNNKRIAARDRLLEIFREFVGAHTLEEMSKFCAAARIPFAPIRRPEDLFSDPHLVATDGLVDVELPGGGKAALPRLPIRMAGLDADLHRHPPAVGQDTLGLLRDLGLKEDKIRDLLNRGIVQSNDAPASPAAL